MRRAEARERQLAALAARQHGVIARWQLLEAGLGPAGIKRRLAARRLYPLYRGVYSFGRPVLTRQGKWFAAALACGSEAVLSHHSAGAYWRLVREQGSLVDITSPNARYARKGIRVHRGRIQPDEVTVVSALPVTSVARTLLDLAEVVDRHRLERIFEEADRLKLLELRALERVCERGRGRRALKPVRKLIAAAREPVVARSFLEQRFVELCRAHRLPIPLLNGSVHDLEVDALWPQQRLIVELDGYAFHGHRGAFERDRTRDATLLAGGYRVIRLTHRRLEEEEKGVAEQLRQLLAS